MWKSVRISGSDFLQRIFPRQLRNVLFEPFDGREEFENHEKNQQKAS